MISDLFEREANDDPRTVHLGDLELSLKFIINERMFEDEVPLGRSEPYGNSPPSRSEGLKVL